MWVDFSSPSLEKARGFYEGLFGWTSQVAPDPQAGGYTLFHLNGKMVAGGGPTFGPDQHPAWSQYVCTTDADATAQKVKDAGGEVVHGPMDVMGQGKMAVFREPTGSFCSIWQPMQHRGAEVVNETGAFSWSELYTRDVPKAVDFYKKVFGWEVEETEMQPMGKYELFKVDGRAVAGGMDMSSIGLPAEVPPHWLVYFTVANTDNTMSKAKELGGKVLAGPNPTPMGPMAVLEDSTGAAFAVIQINQQQG
jgi:predicted enzyme related to lactoylglutathione lyase